MNFITCLKTVRFLDFVLPDVESGVVNKTLTFSQNENLWLSKYLIDVA